MGLHLQKSLHAFGWAEAMGERGSMVLGRGSCPLYRADLGNQQVQILRERTGDPPPCPDSRAMLLKR